MGSWHTILDVRELEVNAEDAPEAGRNACIYVNTSNVGQSFVHCDTVHI